ncbi:hypothetical protein [Paraburkholderia gardini]|nr:hypothetical protein [Paraburkholderia gardini]
MAIDSDATPRVTQGSNDETTTATMATTIEPDLTRAAPHRSGGYC